MHSTEHLSPTDMAEIADAAMKLDLHDAAVILIDALYDQLDGREVEDLSDVVELVRWGVFNKREASPLRRRQLKVLRVLFSFALPFAAVVTEPRYVVSTAAATLAIFEVTKTVVAQATPVVALQSLVLGGTDIRHEIRHPRARHTSNQEATNALHAMLKPAASDRHDMPTDGDILNQFVPYVVMEGFVGPRDNNEPDP